MFEVFNEMYPETKNMDPLPLSEYSLHAIGTPIVEVGDDLKTARALYYSTGMLYRRISTSGKQMAVWMLERYGEDYVREDGFWKIVHECVLNDAGGAQDVTNFAIDCYNKFKNPMGPGGPGGPGPGGKAGGPGKRLAVPAAPAQHPRRARLTPKWRQAPSRADFPRRIRHGLPFSLRRTLRLGPSPLSPWMM